MLMCLSVRSKSAGARGSEAGEDAVVRVREDDVANNRSLGSAAPRIGCFFAEQGARDCDRRFADLVLRAGICRDHVHHFSGLRVHDHAVIA